MTGKAALALAVILVGAGFRPAQAAPRQASIPVKAQVNASCSLGIQSGPLILSTSVDNNGKLDPMLSSRSWTLSGVRCSTASRLTLSASTLRLNPPRSSLSTGQSQTINFIATGSGWTTPSATVETAATDPIGSNAIYTGASQVQNLAKASSITITVSNFSVVTDKGKSQSSAKPVPGAYSATITVSLTPNS